MGELIPRSIGLHLTFALLLGLLVFGGEYALFQMPPNAIVQVETVRANFEDFQNVLGALCLFSAAQMAYVIRLVRGRSRNDFSGSYRLWNWVIAALGITCIGLFLDLHHTVSELIWVLLKSPDLFTATITWQMPMLSAVGLLFLLLRREMRDSRLTSLLLYLSMLCYAAAMISGLNVFSELTIVQIPHVTVAACGFWMEMCGHILLLTTLSLHARYVIHVNPEPPTSTIRQFRVPLPRLGFLRSFRLPRCKFPSIRMKSFRKPAKVKNVVADTNLPNAVPASAKVTAAKTEKSPLPRKKKRPSSKSKMRIEPAHVDPVVETPKIAAQAPALKPPRAAQRPLEEQLDDLSAQELKGLSKKQRRQLRKKHREAQRTALQD